MQRRLRALVRGGLGCWCARMDGVAESTLCAEISWHPPSPLFDFFLGIFLLLVAVVVEYYEYGEGRNDLDITCKRQGHEEK